jgi:superfamily II DNA or RNA helicase
VNESLGDPARSLRQSLGDALFSAADRLAESGGVLEVRVLQGGQIVTGIVGGDGASTVDAEVDAEVGSGVGGVVSTAAAANTGAQTGGQSGAQTGAKAPPKYRVYIRGAQRECSCGVRGGCVHIAAVWIVAARTGGAAQARPAGGARPAPVSAVAAAGSVTQAGPAQHLCYLLQGNGELLRGARVSVWVAQRGTGVGSIVPGSACAFAPRRASISSAFEFPRYVDPADREILPVLPEGDVGTELLMRIVATGRAYLGTLDGAPVRTGEPRAVTLVWRTLAVGDQVLRWEEELEVLLGNEPPLYVDVRGGLVGGVELAGDVELAREMARLGGVGPGSVDEVNQRIEGARPNGRNATRRGSVAGRSGTAAGDESFPRLQVFAPVTDSLRSVAPRLVLGVGEQALLYFVYNGTPVDSRRLRDEDGLVRFMAEGVLHEIPRDPAAEAQFRSQLGELPGVRVAWLEFMMNHVPALKELGWTVEVEDTFPYRIVTASQWYGDLDADHRQAAWFNLRLGVMVDGQPINLLPALTRYLKSSLEGDADAEGCRVADYWLVRLADGRYLPIEIERIQRIANTLIELLERDDTETLSLPRSQSGRLAALNLNVLSSQDVTLTELVEELRSFSGIQALQPPAGFNGALRHYQQEGLGWLQFLSKFRLGGILADDMGLGKTVQTIAHIAMEIESGRLKKPVMIVAPVSALGNWKQELTRFAPSLSVFTWHGAQRRKSLHRLKDIQVVITAYPLLLIDSEIWMAREFGLVILDEAQMIKNPGSKVSQMARALRADARLCLSGTPVENHLGELWSLFEFLQPGLLGDARHFQRLYRTPIEKNGDRARAASLSARLAPFLLRRTKDAVAKELPPKVQIVEPITLDEKQRDFYDGVRLAMHQRILEVVREQGLARSQITILDALLKLRQVCCDPRLVNSDEAVPSAKLDWLTTVLPELIAEGRRILLFSQFTSMLRLIEAAVTALDIPYCLLTGETKDRTSVVQRFQSGEVPLFLISLKAGGTALNLTAADTVIHYDPWWNPAVEAQATDRAHRIGQSKSVFVYKLIAQDTVEEKMLQLQADKRVLAEHLYTQKSASATALNVADLELLLAP